MASLKDDLLGAASELRETHISWVFLHDDKVFKVKKPVSLGFLDFSSAILRKAACEAEVALNRRLAPDVYLGVAPVTTDESGRHQIGGQGPTVDWAVVMRRLLDTDRADQRLQADQLQCADIDRMAQHIAAFHESCRCDAETTGFGDPAQIAGNVRENFAQARSALSAHLGEAQAGALEALQLGFLAENAQLFRNRMAQSRVRDGHGDLKLEHFYLEKDQVVVVDCIEFNDRFRYGDVCSDLAFLAMDLGGSRRVDLAERLLSTYALVSNDYDLYSLVDFYQGYRACVRAKIASMLAADEGASPALRNAADHATRHHFMLALAEQRRPLLNASVVAVGGMIASGKSTVADQLASLLGGPVISSDRVRKHLTGVKATTPLHDAAWQGNYAPDVSRRVYDELFRRARVVLGSGRPVILDASFRTQEDRNRARSIADELRLPFWFVECRANPDLSRSRLGDRAKAASVSDGRLAVADDFAASWEEVSGLAPEQHLLLDTALPLSESLNKLSSVLPVWPTRLRG